MAKKSTSKLKTGTPVSVKAGVTLPESPEVDASGWTGTVVESKGHGSDVKYIIEWDHATCEAMPESYKAHCEEQNLYYRMVCLPATDVDPTEDSST